ncbi:transport permease protein [Paraliobacillus quinghaiensis]|uniref:Transport permease protein n=1 Tax=Paraliobacillus quinghaiensis TaxID=470815 RepID=A0A917WUN4_9BACI|nr:ABC transporter permease [Paraliobacillus quinghaiensis]GGM33948.1 transport permease protein [Paraliobacillus quinghaiensis]
MKIIAIIMRIIQQFIRDKRSLALLFFAPLLILILTWVVLDQESGNIAITTVDLPEKMITKLEAGEMQLIEVDNPDESLREGEIDAIIAFESNALQITIDDSEPSNQQAVMMQIQQALATNQNGVPVEIEKYYDTEIDTTFEYVGPVLIGYFAFFFVFLVGGISFLREKSQGTMERLFATPIRSWEIIIGYLIGFGIFAIIQSFIVVLFGVYVLGVPLQGQLVLVVLITLLLALTALTLGTLLSTFAKNEFQMMQFIPIVIVPQAFFSGLFSIDNAPAWVEWIGNVMPINYGANALIEVMIKGNSIGDILFEISMLFGFSLLFFMLNLVTLVSFRK